MNVRAITLWIALLAVAATTHSQDLRVRQSAKATRALVTEWTLQLEGAKSALDSIISVEYTLHPSFSNPIRRLDQLARNNNFRITFTGRNAFEVPVRVTFIGGNQLVLFHTLTIPGQMIASQEKSVDIPHAAAVIEVANTSKYLKEKLWRWTIFIKTDAKTLADIECVEYTLHPTFPDPIRKICKIGTDPAQSFPLTGEGWGTFTVGIQVMFKDGGSRYLKHYLVFQ